MNQLQQGKIDNLFSNISSLIEQAHQQVKTTVNTTMVITYYCVGYYIVEFEQGGQTRAQYGKRLLKELSARLTERFGNGWSVETLQKASKFYSTYSKIVYSVDEIDQCETSNLVAEITHPKFRNLSWSHYLILMRVENPDARSFYEIECERQQWSVRQLQRQVGSSLYERLALSRDNEEVMRLAQEGQTIEKPTDIIKNPLTLEFLGLKQEAAYTESRLEKAIISRLQDFLLELGRGFLFEGRQKRFSFDEQHFFVDLVCYNRLLQCYVLIDLKTGKLTHQDLGQMQMYVNYFDRYVKQDFEKPTIGILLCESKSDTLVELTLPKDANIYAQQYALYLPDKSLLQEKLRLWILEFKDSEAEKGSE